MMERKYLYFIDVGWRRHKIGITGNIERRLNRLQKLNGKRKIAIHKIIFVRNAEGAEKMILRYFADKRIHYKKFRGSGATEVMGLTWLDCYAVLAIMYYCQHRAKWNVLLGIVLMGFMAMMYYSLLN